MAGGAFLQTVSGIWNSSFEVISTFSAVKDIEMTLNRPRGQYTHSACSFAPLFRLDNLKSFVINCDMAFSGLDDDFRLLAGGFPKFKKFVVSSTSQQDSPAEGH